MANRCTIRDVHLVHHTHMDIGYTDLPHEVMHQHLRHLDHAVALCSGNGARREQERFYWTCESAFLVEQYLACRSAAQGRQLLDCLRQGWIELQAFLTQPLTELPGADELIECVRYAAELGRREGFPVTCAMIDDIGGYAGRLPTVLQGVGVRYLVSGVGAFQVHLPWADLPHLFYLEAKDGARTLIWNLGIDRTRTPQDMARLGAVYGQGALYLVMPFRKDLTGVASRGVEVDLESEVVTDEARERFGELEARLAAEGYPYPELLLQYGGDNRGPDEDLVELLDQINRAADMPAVRLTTPSRCLAAMEARYSQRIPVIRGVLTDPWNLRANPQPTPLKAYREAQRTLRSAYARCALLGQSPSPAGDAKLSEDAMRDLMLYSDHTCGLSEWGWEKVYDSARGTRDPEFDRYRDSWRANRLYAESALRSSQRLAMRGRGRARPADGDVGERIAVFNECAYPAAGPVALYLGRDHQEMNALYDVQTGAPVPFQRVSRNRYVVLSPLIPGYGVRDLRPEFGSARRQEVRHEGDSIGNGILELAIDRRTGRVRSLRSLSTGKEWLRPESETGLGEVVYEVIAGMPPGPVQSGMGRTLRRQRIASVPVAAAVTAAGPVFWEVVADERVAGSGGEIRIRKTYRLYADAPRVDVRVRVDKPESAEKECISVVFPFSGECSGAVFDQNIGTVSPTDDLVPGAMQDLFYAHSWGLLRQEDAGIILIPIDAPAVQIGHIRTGEWAQDFPFVPGGASWIVQLYQNLLNTDCPIWQDILDEFRFVLWLSEGSSPSEGETARISDSVSPGLVAELVSGTSGCLQEGSGLAVEPECVRVLSLAPAAGGKLRLRVENLSGDRVRCVMTWPFSVRDVSTEDLLGRPLARLDGSGGCSMGVDLEPHALASVLVTRQVDCPQV